jgi:pSer/pThr/pTyr-binding forkhead associated (FHA) protein
MIPVASASLEETLLALKIAFLVLLYLFIWRIVRTAARDTRAGQESFILAPQQAQAVGLGRGAPQAARGRFVVIASSALSPGEAYEVDTSPLTVGRGANNDIPLPGDEFSSARHARIEPRRDGVYVEDMGSTNGTFVNGIRLARERRLQPGDVVRIGETDMRFETA